jgi:hypothetical protein
MTSQGRKNNFRLQRIRADSLGFVDKSEKRDAPDAADVATYIGPATARSTLFVALTLDGLRAQSTFAWLVGASAGTWSAACLQR